MGLTRRRAGKKVVADEYERRIASLQQDYSAHVGRWTPAVLQFDWRGYGTAVTALRHRFLSLIAWEEENIR